MAAKCQTPYKTEHSLEFGVKVCERDAVSKAIISASCLLCIHFACEEQIGAKWSRRVNVMYFKKPFRGDTYRRHMVSQHPRRWKEYNELTPIEKIVFFEYNALVIHHNTIKSHFLVLKLLFTCLWTSLLLMLSSNRCFSILMIRTMRLRRSVLSTFFKMCSIL